ncbi:hypothetical protein [Elizabethkingia anophelis]|uniref:hypothetical protein n=1 Tax=Elizabethkingia anophelis TaxID=1117645 RepID=UPI0038915086
MSNKTALQELILKLRENTPPLDKEPDYYRYFRMANENAIKMAEYLLEKEKQQIMEAWLNERDMTWINSNGEDATIEDLKPNAEDYFNSKYENNGTTN